MKKIILLSIILILISSLCFSENVALNKPATASSSTGWLAKGQVPANPDARFAVDGDPETASHTWGGENEWWEVDLLNAYFLSSIIIYGNTAHIEGDIISLLDSNRNLVWTGIHPIPWFPVTYDNNSAGFSNVKYIRIDAGALSPYVVAYEVSAYPGAVDREYLTVLDRDADPGATGQSHNQTVVQNQNGIFVTHLHSRNPSFTLQNWRLSRSTDGSDTFTTVFQEDIGTNTPCLETDEAGNIYVMVGDYSTGHAYLYIFPPGPGNDYASHTEHLVPYGAAQKFAMYYDASRSRIYYAQAPQYGTVFYILDLQGNVLFHRELLADGPSAHPGYPYLAMDANGDLYLAWTSAQIGGGNAAYWAVHFMRSRNGGIDWETLDGTPLYDGDNPSEPPVIGDETGPTDRVTLDDQYEYTSWLQSFTPKDGKLHFAYKVSKSPEEQHYVRWDIATAAEDKRIAPVWSGGEISLLNLSGYVLTHPDEPEVLFWVSKSNFQVACLYSEDNGETWHDHVKTSLIGANPYMIGGFREITPDGRIIGSFTDYKSATNTGDAYFINFPPITPYANTAYCSYENNILRADFSDNFGRPREIRFEWSGGGFTDWYDFSESFLMSLAQQPAAYQVKNGFGTLSEVTALTPDSNLADFDSISPVNYKDFSVLAKTWGNNLPDAGFNAICDISNPPDNAVNAQDLSQFIDNWLQP